MRGAERLVGEEAQEQLAARLVAEAAPERAAAVEDRELLGEPGAGLCRVGQHVAPWVEERVEVVGQDARAAPPARVAGSGRAAPRARPRAPRPSGRSAVRAPGRRRASADRRQGSASLHPVIGRGVGGLSGWRSSARWASLLRLRLCGLTNQDLERVLDQGGKRRSPLGRELLSFAHQLVVEVDRDPHGLRLSTQDWQDTDWREQELSGYATRCRNPLGWQLTP